MVAHVHAVLQPVILGCVLSDSQHHFKPISMPGAPLGEMPAIFTIILFLFSLPHPPPKSQLSHKPHFSSGRFEEDTVLTASCIFSLASPWKACQRKWYMARKSLTLIRSLHYSAGFQEDRSPRQLDGNMNHTMLQQLSHIHPVTEIHLFIISCNTVGDKVHC